MTEVDRECGDGESAYVAGPGAFLIGDPSGEREEGTFDLLLSTGLAPRSIVWGKLALLKAGAFERFDALLTSHGDYQNGARDYDIRTPMFQPGPFGPSPSHDRQPARVGGACRSRSPTT